MNKYYKIENDIDLVKDTDSNAILNNNQNLLEEHKKRKLFFKTLESKQIELENIIKNLEKRIIELENINISRTQDRFNG